MEDDLKGVYVIARRNKRTRFFLPSKLNYFGGFVVEPVMIDNGCSSLLLPLKDGDLQQLLQIFPKEKHQWKVGTSKGVSGNSLTLVITPSIGKIELRLCSDFLKNTCSVSFLRFHLCTEDAEKILSDEEFKFVQRTPKDALFLKNSAKIERRTHALLGQSVLSDIFSAIQHKDILVIVNPAEFQLDWNSLYSLSNYTNRDESELPSGFQDLEDEDHDYSDDSVYLVEHDEPMDE